MRHLSLALLSLTVTLAACKTEPLPPNASREVGGPVPVTRLRAEPYSFTYNSGLTEPVRHVIRDAETWREVWTAIWRRHSPVPPLPAVDFTREMIVVAALGTRSSGGFTILIDSALRSAGGMTVRVRSISPGVHCGVTAALTEPVDVARLPRTGGRVSFEERSEVADCR